MSRHRPFRAICEEARNVYKEWCPDWLGCKSTGKDFSVVLNAAVYTIGYSILTNAALGYDLSEATDDEMGVTEAFMSSAIVGIFMGLLGGQPVVLYGQTGPVVLLYAYMYSIAKASNIPFKPWIVWVNFFSFIMHVLLAAFGTCDFKSLVTAFTEETFAVLVAADFLTTAVLGFATAFSHGGPFKCVRADDCVINGLSTLLLGLWFYSFALKLGGLQKRARWSSARVLRFLSEYYMPLALVATTLISFVPHWIDLAGWPSDGPPFRVPVEAHWGSPAGDFTALAKIGDVPGWAIAAALVPAFLLTVLFYVDQNLSAMMACGGGGLCKVSTPEAFNFEFLLLGVSVLICGLLGLPASSGLIPQNPMHTRALTISEPIPRADGQDVERELDDFGDEAREFGRQSSNSSSLAIVGPEDERAQTKLKVVEQRFSGLLHSVALGVVIFILPVISWIPLGVLYGGFLLLASEAYDLGFIQRILLCLTSPNMREKRDKFPELLHVLDLRFCTVFTFTLVQFLLFLFLYVVAVLLKDIFPVEEGNNWVMVGASFPVIVCIYAIPVRSHLLPRCFSPEVLRVLDPMEHEGNSASTRPINVEETASEEDSDISD
eukprot:TRINITY_DN6131_c0_g1_i2.p1 TRINITY_DN6131_c0_g1~~TRINITY_DN6131_c0_g1_i2.p1  ORF type:complete len:604 (-),score=87.05 TRINITY_DN6131_c0_g1_i2:34-1845(-)